MRNLPVNKTGYLKGAKTAKNPVNIIPSNLITTQGMAFPIKANGKTLYPNTGQYKFNTPYVVETPLKQDGANKIEAGPVLKKAIKENSKSKPAPKPVPKKQLEDDDDNDSWLEKAFEPFDRSGISSYDNVYRSYKKTGLSGQTGLEVLGALPLLGRISRLSKPGIHLDKYSKAEKALQNILPKNKKFSNTVKGLGLTGRLSDFFQNIQGSKDNSGFKYDPNAKDNTLKFNGRNIFPTMSSEYMYQKGTKKAKVEKEGPVMSWIKDRIVDRVRPTTYDMLPRIGEFIAGEKYNAKKKITPERESDDFKVGLAADQDVLALSLGRKPRNKAVVKQTSSKPISDKSKNTEYYSIPSINKDVVVRNYTEGKKRMAKLSKEYPGKIEYNLFEKGLDYLPNQYSRLIPSYKNKKDLEEYRKKGVIYQTDEGMYNNDESFGPMGNFGTWEGKDKKGKYISYKDRIDYQGSLLGKVIKPILNQKDVNIYDRIYLDKEGNPITNEDSRINNSRERNKKKQGSKDMKPLIKYKDGSKGVSLSFSRKEKDPKGGLTQKGVDKYNRATGGNLKMAVTTPPSKLKPGSKAANRRKSFCARMSGVKGPMEKNGKPTRKALALRKWNC
jgi:hypothetical protein